MTAAQLNEKLEANDARTSALTKQAEALIEQARVLREGIARDAADGRDSNAKRRELRDVTDEFEGLNGGIKILKAERETLEAEHTAATIAEAEAAREVALADWGARVDELHVVLGRIYSEDLAALYEAALEASARVYGEERVMEQAGRRVFTHALQRLYDHAVSGGRVMPLLAAIQANAQGHPYSAQWGHKNPPRSTEDAEPEKASDEIARRLGIS